jgi:ubiquitin C-terminal hydrolase
MNQKNQILIDFPLNDLDLSKYVIGYKKKSYMYDLYGVCNHSGSVFGGHYTAYIKNANGKWYNFNDTSVQEIPLSLNNSIISPKSYCLFYRKR